MDKNFFHSLSLVAVLGSGIRNPGWVKIRIRDEHPGSITLDLPYICCDLLNMSLVSQDEIENMVREAEAHAETDKINRERVEAINQAEVRSDFKEFVHKRGRTVSRGSHW